MRFSSYHTIFTTPANHGTTCSQKASAGHNGVREYHIQDFVADYQQDFEYSVLDAQNRKEALTKLPQDVAQNGPIDAFIIRVGTSEFEPFDEELLGPLAPSCKIIASASAGYDEFDVDWMSRSGMWFLQHARRLAEATADMAMFLTLAVLRDAHRAERGARSGSWKAGLVPGARPVRLDPGHRRHGQHRQAPRPQGGGLQHAVRYYNRRRLPPAEEARHAATYCPTLERLLAESDVVSINCPLTAATTNLISHREVGLMKDGAFLVNTARGAIVDEEALIQGLESGKITRAGLDVFVNEPHINDYFRTSDRVICQPHMGGRDDGGV
ncbi:hypothetical protein J3459_017198 [Metarhizium acridum]|nr:hypothetical protein J3459_017198 [Metarhizium acridum]